MIERITFGTTNPAKVNQIRGALSPAGIKVEGFEANQKLPEIVEDGKTAVENARKKALAYAKALGKTVFSMDNALYIDGLPENKQPGLNVRRLPGYSDRPTDQEMIEYYTKLISGLGEKANGHWEFGICIANPEGKYAETTIISPRIFENQACSDIELGYPLESIQIDPRTGKYIAEMSQEEKGAFWQEAMGKPLLEFVESVDLS